MSDWVADYADEWRHYGDRDEVIGDALEAAIDADGWHDAEHVYTLRVGRLADAPPPLSRWLDVEDLLERLDERQGEEIDHSASALPTDARGYPTTAGLNVEPLQRVLAAALDVWCERERIYVPWREVIEEREVRVRVTVRDGEIIGWEEE